jgi:hypothetical protein
MSKKPMTWLELIKLKLSEEKAKGKSPSINDIMPLAKKEWAQIKDGKHPLYEQGKAQTFARKKSGTNKMGTNKMGTNKTKKNKKGSSSSPAGMHEVLAEAKLCTKCKKKVEKVLKKKGMKGGSSCGMAAPTQTGGNCNGSCGLTGGCVGCVL